MRFGRLGTRRHRGAGDQGASSDVAAPSATDSAIAEIGASGLFDADWYLENNPDIAAAGVDPLSHYVTAGAAEGRLPGPRFDVLWYLGEHPGAGAPDINPILHYLRHGRALGRTPKALDEGQAFDSFLAASHAGQLPFAAKLRSEIDHVHYALNPPRPAPPAGGLPLPPLELSVRIGSNTLESFEDIGRGVKDTILRSLPEGFDFRGSRCLDFGCGIGRVIRHFAKEAETAEIWGCDIDGTSIRWAIENMTPPFRFYRMAQTPSLPFEDSSFDLIYTIAVFSQVFDDWHQWAMELRRVLKPGGILFLTYAGQTPFEEMLSLPYGDFADHPGLYIKNPFNSWNRGGPMVFMSPGWVERYWGSIFDIDFIAPDALLDYQSICLLRKPERGAPPRRGAKVVELATRQAFHPDALGKIWSQVDAARPLLDSYGIEVSGPAEAGGWIVLRGDEAETLTLAVDGEPVDCATEWRRGSPYRDWPDTHEMVFRTEFDAGRMAPGRHRLEVRVVGRRGARHEMSIPLKVS